MDTFRDLEALYFLIGRRLLDGAASADLAERLGCGPEVVEEGWRVTQEQLSLDLALTRDEPFRLLTTEELRSEGTHCLRRLIEWRERLLRPVSSQEPSGIAASAQAIVDELAERAEPSVTEGAIEEKAPTSQTVENVELAAPRCGSSDE